MLCEREVTKLNWKFYFKAIEDNSCPGVMNTLILGHQYTTKFTILPNQLQMHGASAASELPIPLMDS